jgi:hypothetical protein
VTASISAILATFALVVALFAFLKGGQSGELYLRKKWIALRHRRRLRRAHTLSDTLLARQAALREKQELSDLRRRDS